MPIQQRILVVAGALFALWVVANRIRKNRILMSDAIFWVVLVGVLVVLAIFPGITFFFASVLRFTSPANLVFLVVVALLLYKSFQDSIEISTLKSKVETLAQEIALNGYAVSNTQPTQQPITENRKRAVASEESSEKSIPDFLRKS